MAARGTLLTSSSNQCFLSLVPCPECLGGSVLILGVVSGLLLGFGFLLLFCSFFPLLFLLVFITNSYTASSSCIIKLQELES